MSRSYLFIPGNTPNMIQNYDVFDSDAIILDVEDSVVVYDKDAARDLVKNFVQRQTEKNVSLYVRINDVNSPFFKADIAAFEATGIDGYVIPKASKEAMEEVINHTSKSLIPIIESPLAVLHAEEIANSKQVIGLLLGAEDCTKEMNIARTPSGIEIEYMRHHLALVCHAYHIEAIDTPWIHKDDEEGLKKDVLYAAQIGFTAKSAIHPNHVPIINQAFTPSKEEILAAKRIVKKADEHQKGAFSLDGKMVDAPIIEKAKKLLETAKKYNIL